MYRAKKEFLWYAEGDEIADVDEAQAEKWLERGLIEKGKGTAKAPIEAPPEPPTPEEELELEEDDSEEEAPKSAKKASKKKKK